MACEGCSKRRKGAAIIRKFGEVVNAKGEIVEAPKPIPMDLFGRKRTTTTTYITGRRRQLRRLV